MPATMAMVSKLRDRARKLKRIAKGFADSETRDAYVAESRRRLRREEVPERDPDVGRPRCLVCGSRRLRERHLTYARDTSKSCEVRVCRACGYVHMPGHVVSRYKTKTDMEQ